MLVDLRMSSLDQMKLMGLIDLTLILILVSNSKGESWSITVPKVINATNGSSVTIGCMYSVPPKHNASVQVYWKKPGESNFKTSDNDKNAFVFHPNNSFVLEKYRGKTRLIGNNIGNCSLKIDNISENEPNIYVRVIATGDNYSFRNDLVSIRISGQGAPPNTLIPVFSTGGPTQETVPKWHVAIYVPVVAILIIIFVVGIVFGMKHKRSKSVIREDSGHYENCSRANQAKREAPCKKQDNINLSELKGIDDPVYINLEAPPDQMDQSMDHTDNIYANVDYSK